MRALVFAALTTVVLATGFHYALNTVQESSADAYATSPTRLDQQEQVNIYGRQLEG